MKLSAFARPLALAVLTFMTSFAIPSALQAQRIPQALQSLSATSPRVALPQPVPPRVALATDLGPAPAAAQLSGINVRFSLTPAQDAALDQLLEDQQNPATARYHQWLTPDQYAAQFGLSSSDLARIIAYFTAAGLTVTPARSHTALTVSGSVAQLDSAFGTSIHALTLGGEQHLANIAPPQLPAALASITAAVTGLDDFHLKPRAQVRRVLAPQYTSSASGNHFLAPGDSYTIYDINPLLNSSIRGTGITIAVMGQTDISLASAAAFRTASGLPANPPSVTLYGTDPGVSSIDLPEAMLDVEWSGAIAPAAAILYVNSTDVINGSLTQAVDNNLAPILTMSYGDCEQDIGAAALATYQQLFRQANAQGQTIVGVGGDTGATDCDYQAITASRGLAVDFPASSPNVTGIGGTMFNEGTGTYFGTTNNANAGSALSYIPETVWNETVAAGALAAGGGGLSAYFTKPAYQTGLGVPNDFARDVPDLSLDAAYLHDGYLFCVPGDCVNGFRDAGGFLDTVGGTSIAAPQFAAMLALLEQKIQARVGNANPVLYGLANSTYATAVFHDITTGSNAVPCTAGTLNCPTGGSIGYSAATGYDLATGWGSVDAFNLVSDWLLVTPTGITSTQGTAPSTTTLTDTAATATAGMPITFTATVASGTATVTSTPTGTVQFLVDNVASGAAIPISSSGNTATFALPTATLAPGTHSVTAAYSGSTIYAGSKSTVLISITSATLADFSLSPSTAAVTVASGKTANGITFTVAPLSGFTGNVTFSASTTSSILAASSNPSFSVNSVTLTATSTTGSTVLTLTAFLPYGRTGTALARLGSQLGSQIGTQASSQPARQSPSWPLPAAGLAFAGLLCVFVPKRRRVPAPLAILIPALISAGALTLSGCGNGYNNNLSTTNTPAGTYTVLVTAAGTTNTGATISHNATLTLTVQ